MKRLMTDAQIQAATIDEMNDRLASGRARRADAIAWRDAWNGNGKHFTSASLFGCRLILWEGEPIEAIDSPLPK